MLIRADARLLPLADHSVHCCVTSPPYYGLRNYGNDARQIGLEDTPQAYVAALVAVFADVWRVLRDDGTLWLNIGDSYAAPAKNRTESQATAKSGLAGGMTSQIAARFQPNKITGTLKRKDIIGIPWMVAFALRDFGWYLRAPIVWAKGASFCETWHGSVMPEAVLDRPSSAYEMVFLLSKSDRYYYDYEAVREEGVYPGGTLAAKGSGTREGNRRAATGHKNASRDDGNHPHNGYAEYDGYRNLRNVWAIPVKGSRDAHFAMYPEALVEPCIMAGCPAGGTVLDPFVGSGTTVRVAQRLGRRGIGVDLGYHGLSRERTAQRGFVFQEERING